MAAISLPGSTDRHRRLTAVGYRCTEFYMYEAALLTTSYASRTGQSSRARASRHPTRLKSAVGASACACVLSSEGCALTSRYARAHACYIEYDT